jgi:LEA14-like dessication related protein
MKQNKVFILLIILIIVNIIFSGSLVYVITSIKAPDIIACVDILDLNQDNVEIQIKINISNPNFFSIMVENFNIICMNESYFVYGNMNILGGEIKGSSNNTFVVNGSFSFENYDFESIINEISGEIGFNFYGIMNKKVPINIKLIANIENLVSDLDPPEITINAEILEVNEDGILFNGSIMIFNPNKYKIFIDDISLSVESDNEDIVGEIDIDSGEIDSNSYKIFPINGNLLYSTLNYDEIFIKLEAKVGARLAGFEKFINISTRTIFDVPNIQDLLLINETMDFSISAEFKLRLDGVLTIVGFKIYNPSEIPMHMNDLVCYISSFDDNQSVAIVQRDMQECMIPSKNEVCIITELTIPYVSLITSGNDKLLPDWFVITIKGNFFIEGTNQYIPISFNGYISPDFF